MGCCASSVSSNAAVARSCDAVNVSATPSTVAKVSADLTPQQRIHSEATAVQLNQSLQHQTSTTRTPRAHSEAMSCASFDVGRAAALRSYGTQWSAVCQRSNSAAIDTFSTSATGLYTADRAFDVLASQRTATSHYGEDPFELCSQASL